MLKARNYSPAVMHGAKWMPEDIAGMIGLPSVGNIFYVDPGAGSDTANSGTSRDDAFATVTAAYAAMTADQDDVCVIAPSSSTGRTSEAASINWAKRRTHIIGNGPLRTGWNRAGINFASTATTPSFTVSATNCSFTNIIISNFNDINVLVNVSAAYNTFNYVHFAGIANATTGADTAGRSLVITEADDNHFNNCMIGVDTVTNSAANAQVELIGNTAVARTQFNDCIFNSVGDDGGIRFVLFTGAYSSEVYTLFRNCLFLNSRGGSTTLTVAMTIPASVNGKVLLDNPGVYGVTDWADVYTNLYVLRSPTNDTTNQGFADIAAT